MTEQTNDPALLERALNRERKRRAAAESLLEEKSRELFHSYKELEAALEELESNKDQLVQSEKMASLGVMAAGVAHEINNPIGFVQSNLNTLGEYAPVFAEIVALSQTLMQESPEAPAAKSLKELLEAEDIDFVLEDSQDILKESRSGIERVRDIVAGLKTFSHMDGDEQTEVQINDVLANTLNIARGQLKHQCEIIETLDDIPPVLGNSGRLGQVFMNLIVNAGQALPESAGRIEISSRLEDDQVVVTVADNGSGISPEHQKKLFEPFFTTKDVGEGTGLGLSISLGIINDHKGQIECESAEGQGTTFTVTLPVQRH